MTVLYLCPFANCRAACPLPDRPVYVLCAHNGRTYSVAPDGECAIAPWETIERPKKWTHDSPRVRSVDPS